MDTRKRDDAKAINPRVFPQKLSLEYINNELFFQASIKL
jgi:hypothetical protein